MPSKNRKSEGDASERPRELGGIHLAEMKLNPSSPQQNPLHNALLRTEVDHHYVLAKRHKTSDLILLVGLGHAGTPYTGQVDEVITLYKDDTNTQLMTIQILRKVNIRNVRSLDMDQDLRLFVSRHCRTEQEHENQGGEQKAA